MEQCVFILLQYLIWTQPFKDFKVFQINIKLGKLNQFIFTWCCNPTPCHVTAPNLSVRVCVNSRHTWSVLCVYDVLAARQVRTKMALKPV